MFGYPSLPEARLNIDLPSAKPLQRERRGPGIRTGELTCDTSTLGDHRRRWSGVRLEDLPGHADATRGRRSATSSSPKRPTAKKFTGEEEEEEEEVLTVFASQAAATITNARRHRSERRARADLEALVETSPVEVVVTRCTRRPAARSTARRGGSSRPLPSVRPSTSLEVVSVHRSDGGGFAGRDSPGARRSAPAKRCARSRCAVGPGWAQQDADQRHADPSRTMQDLAASTRSNGMRTE